MHRQIKLLFFSNMWACYLEKQPNLKKWVEIKKELGSAGANVFAQKHDRELWDCNKVNQFWFRLFNVWPRPSFWQKIAKIERKVIAFFLKDWDEIGPWFSNISIARWLNFVECIICFFPFGILHRLKWGQTWEKLKKSANFGNV